MIKVHTILPGKVYQRSKFYRYPKCEKLEALAKLGIDIVVSLYGPPDTDLEELFWYVHMPISDGQYLDKRIPELVKLLVDYIRDGHTVLSHCNAGRNRSGLLNALIVRELLGVSGKEALRIVRAGRPNAVTSNPYFEAYLESLP